MKKYRRIFDTDRSFARRAKLGKHWCWKCDGNLVGDGETCSRCGKKDHNKRMKKE